MPQYTVHPEAGESYQACKDRAFHAIDALCELSDYLDGTTNRLALRDVICRYDELEPNDEFWTALVEFAAPRGGGFDDRLRHAVVRLLVAADDAYSEQAEDPHLTVRTFRRLQAAHELIGAELDRIGSEA
jgi:hypothetical protein